MRVLAVAILLSGLLAISSDGLTRAVPGDRLGVAVTPAANAGGGIAEETPKESPFDTLVRRLETPDEALSFDEFTVLKQLKGCWDVPPSAGKSSNTKVRLDLELNPDGTRKSANISNLSPSQDGEAFRALAQTAMMAIRNPLCARFDLPPERYNSWKHLTIVFDPHTLVANFAKTNVLPPPPPRPQPLLTSSDIDALYSQFDKCWNPPAGARNLENPAVEIQANFNKDGSVNSVTITDQSRYANDENFRTLANSVVRAVKNPACLPIHLPVGKYEIWKQLGLIFIPNLSKQTVAGMIPEPARPLTPDPAAFDKLIRSLEEKPGTIAPQAETTLNSIPATIPPPPPRRPIAQLAAGDLSPPGEANLGAGLEVIVTPTRTTDKLVIVGEIHNAASDSRIVPKIRVSLRDANNNDLATQVLDPPTEHLSSGARATFSTQFPDTAQATGVDVTFLPEQVVQKIETTGINATRDEYPSNKKAAATDLSNLSVADTLRRFGLFEKFGKEDDRCYGWAEEWNLDPNPPIYSVSGSHSTILKAEITAEDRIKITMKHPGGNILEDTFERKGRAHHLVSVKNLTQPDAWKNDNLNLPFLRPCSDLIKEATNKPNKTEQAPNTPTASTSPSTGPSFDCQKAKAPLAQILCADPELSALDVRFVDAYRKLLSQLSGPAASQLKQEDINFINGVQKQCGIPTAGSPNDTPQVRTCVKNAYEKQRAVWVSRLNSEIALPNAARSIPLLSPTPVSSIDGDTQILRQFGLIGTFSIDCAVPLGGPAKVNVWHTNPGQRPDVTTIAKDGRLQTEIDKAESISETSLRLHYRRNNQHVETTIEKIGDGYRVVRIVADGRVETENGILLSSNMPWGVMHPCDKREAGHPAAAPENSARNVGGDKPQISTVRLPTADIHTKTGETLIYIGSDPQTNAQFWAATKVNDPCYESDAQSFFGGRTKNLDTVVTVPDIEVLYSDAATKKLMLAAAQAHLKRCPGQKTNYWPIWVVPANEVQNLDPVNGRISHAAKGEASYSTGELTTYNNSLPFEHQQHMAAEATSQQQVAEANRELAKVQGTGGAAPMAEEEREFSRVRFDIGCRQPGDIFTSSMPIREEFTTRITIVNNEGDNTQLIRTFFIDNKIGKFLDYLQKQASKSCSGSNSLDLSSVVVGNRGGGSFNGVFSAWKKGSADWVISNNELGLSVARAEQQRQAAEKIANEKRERKTKFLSGASVGEIVDVEQLQRNPFPFKGQTVGVYVAFGRMTSETTAIFTQPGNGVPAITANKVPPTLFRNNVLVILALRVNGLKDGLVEGDLVGQYFCQQQGCQDFF